MLQLFVLHIALYIFNPFFYCNSSIRLWALTGQVLMEMVGHTSIVYSVDSHVSGLIVSGSEDCSAKIWKGGCLWLLLLFGLRPQRREWLLQ